MPASSSSSSSIHLSSHRPRRDQGHRPGLLTTMKPRRQEPRRQEPKKVLVTSSKLEVVRYGECRKNHAASIGGYAVDGCREFMASGEEGTSASLLCAACGCHRSFHKREVETEDACDCSSVSTSRGS